ncbi:MAG: hypothetical protein AAF734_10800, partial [Bacteroidota bacterium]
MVVKSETSKFQNGALVFTLLFLGAITVGIFSQVYVTPYPDYTALTGSVIALGMFMFFLSIWINKRQFSFTKETVSSKKRLQSKSRTYRILGYRKEISEDSDGGKVYTLRLKTETSFLSIDSFHYTNYDKMEAFIESNYEQLDDEHFAAYDSKKSRQGRFIIIPIAISFLSLALFGLVDNII